ncbi:hypothetical protein FVEN_g3523 [Fusarium venenatum]|uniref:Uncharacterized protein n=1 Tax=Fusarium venenatum TaxID=56646 RepID=A0A2L2TK69_9HYPO|nr:uncharacterized protein FVRRES_13468 [Fusarium venenatum]KAG8358770.1 hypothetical protein FVEN_g3523 [Fusarium venenatum]CEI41202.1 unnamed protein product [Fusarium venenatum]
MHEKLNIGTSWLDLSDQEREIALHQYKGDEEHALKERWCALSAQDHKLALSYIKHIVFSGAIGPYTSNKKTKTTMSKIPKLLSTFPALRQCDLILWKEESEDGIRDYQLYFRDQDGADDQQDNHAQREIDVALADGLRGTIGSLENLMKSRAVCLNQNINESVGRQVVIKLFLLTIKVEVLFHVLTKNLGIQANT